MNVTGCSSGTPAIDNTKAVLDSCDLKCNSSPQHHRGEFNIQQEKIGKQHESKMELHAFASIRLCMVGRGKIKDKSVWKILSWASTPYETTINVEFKKKKKKKDAL